MSDISKLKFKKKRGPKPCISPPCPELPDVPIEVPRVIEMPDIPTGVAPSQKAIEKSKKMMEKLLDVRDVFDSRAAETIGNIGSVDMYQHDVELLKVEWCMKWPLIKPLSFLMEKKGFSYHQAHKLKDIGGGEEGWLAAKGLILDRLTESVVKRHIDQLAEVQETHIKASKIGLAKAVEMLSKFQIEPLIDAKSGKIVIDPKTKKPIYRGFRSIDLLNCLSAVEKAQQIYRRAMGLPNEEAGLAQILDKVNMHFNQTNIQQNVTVEAPPEPVDPVKEKMNQLAAEMTYDDIFEFVEFRREQRKKQKEQQQGVSP